VYNHSVARHEQVYYYYNSFFLFVGDGGTGAFGADTM
jgi:hypothetical protein